MTDQEKLEEYLESVKADLKAANAMGGDYVMLVLIGGKPALLYRDLVKFRENVLTDISDIDPQYSIEFTHMLYNA